VRGPLSANDIEKLLAPSFNAQIEKLLALALSDKEDKEIRNVMGKPATPEDAAKELYHAMLTVGRAVATLAKQKPEALKGIGRGHLDTVIYYDGKARHADVEGWLNLVELGAEQRRTRNRARSSGNDIIPGVVDAAVCELTFWRSLRKFDGKGARPIFKSDEEVKAALNPGVRRDSTIGLNGEILVESDRSFEERVAYAPELHLINAAKRLPELSQEGSALYIWNAALLGWLAFRYGSKGRKWHQHASFDGITQARERGSALAELVKKRFQSLIASEGMAQVET
jgi:hypothetical protein